MNGASINEFHSRLELDSAVTSVENIIMLSKMNRILRHFILNAKVNILFPTIIFRYNSGKLHIATMSITTSQMS